MSLEKLRIGIAQFNPYPGDIEGNERRIIERIEQARTAGVQLLLFPECAITAYAIGDKHKNAAFIRENMRALERIAAFAQGISVIIGYIELDDSRTMNDNLPARYNAYALLHDGRIHARGRKHFLIDDGIFDDSRHYLPASPDTIRPHTITIDGEQVRLGVLICQDAWDAHQQTKPARLLVDGGAELLCIINASRHLPGKRAERLELIRRHAHELHVPIIYANTVGTQDNGKNLILFDGASFAVNESAELIHAAPQFTESLEQIDLIAKPIAEAAYDRIRELHDALVYAIADFYEKIGAFTGAVIGLSGGIDSAVDACLLVEALGPERVLAINMPSRYNSQQTRSIAAAIAERLGIEYLIHPIEEVVAQKIHDLKQVSKRDPKTITIENIQARERGNILMEHAQERGAMVVGNGNKTEFQRGYATLYGDILGALMPLGDVNKLDVYALARHINAVMGAKPIPEELFTLPPSAELSAEQDVTKGKGDPFDYFIESPLGVELVERVRSPQQLIDDFTARRLDPELWVRDRAGKTIYDKCDAERFATLVHDAFGAIKASYFKRVQSPPIIIVSRRAFGFDYRETLYNRSRQ